LQIHLTSCQCDNKRHIGNLSIRILCADVDKLYEELRAKGAKFRCEPSNEEWGFREFQIIDPDGNWLKFYGPIRGVDADDD